MTRKRENIIQQFNKAWIMCECLQKIMWGCNGMKKEIFILFVWGYVEWEKQF